MNHATNLANQRTAVTRWLRLVHEALAMPVAEGDTAVGPGVIAARARFADSLVAPLGELLAAAASDPEGDEIMWALAMMGALHGVAIAMKHNGEFCLGCISNSLQIVSDQMTGAGAYVADSMHRTNGDGIMIGTVN